MRKIEQIVDKYYADMAGYIYELGHDSLPSTKSLDDRIIADIRDMFFVMLNRIVAAVTNINDSKLTEDQRQAILSDSKEYYRDIPVFTEDKLKLFPILEKYAPDRDKCVKNLTKRLYKVVPIHRIAELAYYKICHRRYNKGLEIAFREIVKGVTLNSTAVDDILNKRTAKKIQKITSSLAWEQAKKAYNAIYGNPDILEEYKLDKDKYFTDIINQSVVLMATTPPDKNPSGFEGIDYYVKKFEAEVPKTIEKKPFYSFKDCVDKYYETYKIKVDDQSYANVFKNMISPLAGYRYDKGTKKKYHIEYNFILETLYKDLNIIVHYFLSKGKARNYNKIFNNNGSRFMYINSLDDFKIAGLIIKVYLQLLKARCRYTGIDFKGEDMYNKDEAMLILENYN